MLQRRIAFKPRFLFTATKGSYVAYTMTHLWLVLRTSPLDAAKQRQEEKEKPPFLFSGTFMRRVLVMRQGPVKQVHHPGLSVARVHHYSWTSHPSVIVVIRLRVNMQYDVEFGLFSQQAL